jgi:hypothetical protein
MFKDNEGTTAANITTRRAKAAKYRKGIYVIFNKKAYANGENLKQWARQQYKWYSAFSLSANKS